MRKNGKSIRFREYQWAILKEVARRQGRSVAAILDDFIWLGLHKLGENDLVTLLEESYYEWATNRSASAEGCYPHLYRMAKS